MQTSLIKKPRIESIDLLKGLVMVVMALDHVRDYFHAAAFEFSPSDPLKSDLPIFFTRWITHFCAPTFSFLAGLSAYMVSKRKTKLQLSFFLASRGLWLVFAELTIIVFGWFFDIHFHTFGLLTIWSLGVSMLVLAALIYLPDLFILLFSLVLIGGHNLVDNIHFEGNILWSVLHEMNFFHPTQNTLLIVAYPLIPWIAVMSLGYYFGRFYNSSVDTGYRKKMFNIIGLSAIILFAVLRYTNFYGDKSPSESFSTISGTLISFFNPSKYPPSLQYLLMTLGVAFIFLANTGKLKGKVIGFFSTFGRVPFFYYIIHIYFIHLLAMLFAKFSGYSWDTFVLSTWISMEPKLKGYGFSLTIVYLVWIGVIVSLYPLCRKFDKYKQAHKEKWWLSYL